MDKLFQSVALVQQNDGTQTKMLLSWQKDLNRWEFIVADRLNRESFRESVTREVAWQLSLNRKSDFLVPVWPSYQWSTSKLSLTNPSYTSP